MRRRSQLLRWAATAVAGALALGSGTAAASTATAKGSKADAACSKLDGVTINGSGSSFQQAFEEANIAAFEQKYPGITVNYAGGGSGKGRQEFADQVVQFAGTDGLYTAADLAKIKGGEWYYVPTVAAPITVAYNLPAVKKLKLSPETIAKIFQRQVTRWDDAAIAADNPGVSLPSTPITVAHRSDGSGTTEQFTKYLAGAVPSIWTLGSGSTVNWPADTQGGPQNTGVANIVKSAEGGIGYVDYSDAVASGLRFASVKNASGRYVKPGLKAATQALTGVALNTDGTYNPLNSPNPKAYPITSPTWVLAYKSYSDVHQGTAVRCFLTFQLTEGQKLAKTVNFAPLPESFVAATLARINQIGT